MRLETALAQAGFRCRRRCRWSRGSCRCRWTTGTALLNLSPQRQRQRTIETLLTWLLAAAVREPTLFVVEDLHWVDPSTLELLTMLVEREQAARLLTLLTFRPEFEPPWASHENLVLIELSSLDRPRP